MKTFYDPQQEPGANAGDSSTPIPADNARGLMQKYSLCLYIAGATPRSMRAVANLKKICAEYLHDNYTLDVVDLYQQPQLAEGEQIIAVPTLIRKLPLPVRRIVGDLSDTVRVLAVLDLGID